MMKLISCLLISLLLLDSSVSFGQSSRSRQKDAGAAPAHGESLSSQEMAGGRQTFSEAAGAERQPQTVVIKIKYGPSIRGTLVRVDRDLVEIAVAGVPCNMQLDMDDVESIISRP